MDEKCGERKMNSECYSHLHESLKETIVSSMDNLNSIVNGIKEENNRLFYNYETRISSVESSVKRWNIVGVCIVVFCVFVLAVEMFLFKRNTALEKRDAAIEQAIEQIKNELKETIKIELNGGKEESNQ